MVTARGANGIIITYVARLCSAPLPYCSLLYIPLPISKVGTIPLYFCPYKYSSFIMQPDVGEHIWYTS